MPFDCSSSSLLFNNANHADKFLSSERDARYVSSVSGNCRVVIATTAPLGLYGQAIKRIRWMPRQPEAMKDVEACDKARRGGKQPVTRAFLNGETHPVQAGYPILNP